MNKSESITKISAALVKSQSEMGNATKGASNPFFKSKFADLNSVREACIPVLNANGITVLQPTTVQDGKPYVETLLLHDSGEYLASLTEIIANKQNDAQAHGSGVSYARRYGLQSFLCIGAEDDDGEKAHGRGKPAERISGHVTLNPNRSGEVLNPPITATLHKTTGVSEMINIATANTAVSNNLGSGSVTGTNGTITGKATTEAPPKKGFGVVKPKPVETPVTKTTDAWE